jgi:hypothetical protein
MASLLIDLVNNALVAPFNATGITVSTQGASADFHTANAPNSTDAIINVVGTGSVTTGIVQIEESTDGSTNWTVIPGMVATFTVTTAAANVLQMVRGQRSKRYVRANAVTVTAPTTATGALNVLIIGQKGHTPVTASGADLYPSS